VSLLGYILNFNRLRPVAQYINLWLDKRMWFDWCEAKFKLASLTGGFCARTTHSWAHLNADCLIPLYFIYQGRPNQVLHRQHVILFWSRQHLIRGLPILRQRGAVSLARVIFPVKIVKTQRPKTDHFIGKYLGKPVMQEYTPLVVDKIILCYFICLAFVFSFWFAILPASGSYERFRYCFTSS
jgi:hypothetical protein